MLTNKEAKRLNTLLNKIKAPQKGLPQPVFDALTKLVPLVACELVIVNKQKELLLTWRDDQYWRGWHFPGGLMRFGEIFSQSLRNTARRELRIALKDHKFLFPMNYNRGPRGHGVSLVFLCTAKGKPKAGQFFKTMPRDIISSHRQLWKKLRQLGI